MKLQLGVEADAFFKSLDQLPPTSIRLHHLKGRSSFDPEEKVPWCDTGFYLHSRPFFHLDPHWHGGAYYVQEASSMILDYVLHQLDVGNKPQVWLDLCAAPGGKTGILAKHLGTGDILVANEANSQRRSILRENLIKAGYINTFISGESAAAFQHPFADLILVDAPCAGEGMMRKEPEAIQQWAPALVQSCALMQKQIVEDAVKALLPGGCLVYSTCSYSMDENINNIAFFMDTHDLLPAPISFPAEWNILEIRSGNAIGYQLYPHRVKGEGLFIAVLKKTDRADSVRNQVKKIDSSFIPLPGWLSSYINSPVSFLLKKSGEHHQLIYAAAEEKANEVIRCIPRAEIIFTAGELKGKDFIPSHALAMSGMQDDNYITLDVDLNAALDYLERSTGFLPVSQTSGWYLVRYQGTILGWVKATTQGWKNHYPMNWRLRDRHRK